MNYVKLVVSILMISLSTIAQAQVNARLIEQALNEEVQAKALPLKNINLIKDFYACFNYQPAWVTNESFRIQLLRYLDETPLLGLNKSDYQPAFVDAFMNKKLALNTSADSLTADLLFSDAALHFFREVAFGNQVPEMGYNVLKYSPDCLNIPMLLAASLSENKFHLFLQELECNAPEYHTVKAKISQFTKMLADTMIKANIFIRSTKVDLTNRPLIEKLYQLSIIDSLETNFSQKELKEKVKIAQRLFSLMDDGIIRSTLIEELNVPLEVRIIELQRTLNTIRWLRCIRMQSPHFVLVNIPSATLLVLENDKVTMESKLIVGKKYTRTPVFSSRITEVVLYPYWNVPKSIATKELLPEIKRNPGYLKTNNFQVVDLQGKVVDPATINWQLLEVNNFPYILRQSTGCDNSLGLVKINFFSPYGVYLHDTPWKILFAANKRYFSHGCMRVQKAMELAHLLLKDNTIAIDTLEEKGCLINQKPIPVAVSEQMPLFVLYNTAWVDSSANVRFYEDVYNKRPATISRSLLNTAFYF